MGVVGTILKGLVTVGTSAYDQAKDANKQDDDYKKFTGVMDAATKRGEACKAGELSRNCGISATQRDHYQDGMTTHDRSGRKQEHTPGSAPLRIYTVVGSDGQIINAQGHDLSKTVKYTVMHKDGTSYVEDISAEEATKRIQRDAGYATPGDKI